MKLLLLLLCMTAMLNTSAQKIRFTDTSNRWSLLDVGNDGLLVYGQPLPEMRFERDTVIAGVAYHRLTIQGIFDGGYAIREDTAAGKIYFRFMRAATGGLATDTGERLFFDYNMRLNDTLRIRYNAAQGIAHYVSAFDSLYVGAQVYKKWTMTPWLGSNVQASEYTFIEGIGCLGGPGWPAFNRVFEHRGQLRCFTNKGVQPACHPAPLLPWRQLQVQQGVLQADSFDNALSCSYRLVPNAVEAVNAQAPVTMTPNPGGAEISLTVPAAISAGQLQISDAVGRVSQRLVVRSGKTNIGQYLSTPGVYYYTLQDAATGRRYTGRFIFR